MNLGAFTYDIDCQLLSVVPNNFQTSSQNNILMFLIYSLNTKAECPDFSYPAVSMSCFTFSHAAVSRT